VFAEAVDRCSVSDALWKEAAQHFSDSEMLDLVMLAGLYGYASRITLVKGIEVDEGLTAIAHS
jgi:alkylhydroperoxidase family enzyme